MINHKTKSALTSSSCLLAFTEAEAAAIAEKERLIKLEQMKQEEEERHRRKMEEDRIAQEEMQRQLVEMQRVSMHVLVLHVADLVTTYIHF